uniref:LITAF domain-containing protein n=1 Tax=Pundamilia nyererei TaxID=303518 RepID=A0A3B4F207_9CICH
MNYGVTYIRDLNDDFPRNPPRLPLYTPVMPQDPAHGKQAKHPLLIILVFSKNLTSLSLTRSCLVFCHKCQMTVDVRKRYAVGSLTLLTVGVLTLFGCCFLGCCMYPILRKKCFDVVYYCPHCDSNLLIVKK